MDTKRLRSKARARAALTLSHSAWNYLTVHVIPACLARMALPLNRTSFLVAVCCSLSGCAVISQPTKPEKIPKEAESANVTARIRVPPRVLSDQQRKLLGIALRSGPLGKVNLVFEEGDREAANFANQLATALLLAGENAELHSLKIASTRDGAPLRLFMRIPAGPPPPHAEALFQALDVAHLPWEPAIATGNPPGLLTITVAAKPLPEFANSKQPR